MEFEFYIDTNTHKLKTISRESFYSLLDYVSYQMVLLLLFSLVSEDSAFDGYAIYRPNHFI